MKPKIFCLLLFALMSVNAFTQIRFGLRAGINSSSIKADEVTQGTTHISTVNNAKVGFHFGLMSQIAFAGMYIQPEALLSSTSGEVRISDVSSSTVMNQKYTQLNVPVIVGAKIGPLRLGLGPVASVMLNKASDAVDFSGTSIKNKYHNATFGYQLDAGLDLWKIALDLKYEGNLSKFGNGVMIGGTEQKFDTRVSQVILSVGLFF